MNTTDSKFKHFFRYIGKTGILRVLLMTMPVIGLILAFAWLIKGCGVSTGSEGKIGITPVQIESIRDIGQWEFLAISDEELVDTIRHGFFGDDELSRIYYGTLRLGINLQEAGEGWISMDKDTVTATLPPIRLLDEKFIDEGRTQAFFEEGKWSETDKAKLTRKAYRMMKQRCLTPDNIRRAELHASEQFASLIQAMGFEFVRVEFKSAEMK